MAAKKWDQGSVISPGDDWDDLTPSDDEEDNFDPIPKAIQCTSATGGQFVAVSKNGNAKTFYTQPGQYHPIRPVRINSTGTDPSLTFVGLIE